MNKERYEPLMLASLFFGLGLAVGAMCRRPVTPAEKPRDAWQLQTAGGIPIRIETNSGNVDMFDPQAKQWRGLGRISEDDWAKMLSSTPAPNR